MSIFDIKTFINVSGLILNLLVVAVLAEHYFLERVIDEPCHLNHGRTGVCRTISSCQTLSSWSERGIEPVICHFQGEVTLICCDIEENYTLPSTVKKSINQDEQEIKASSSDEVHEKRRKRNSADLLRSEDIEHDFRRSYGGEQHYLGSLSNTENIAKSLDEYDGDETFTVKEPDDKNENSFASNSKESEDRFGFTANEQYFEGNRRHRSKGNQGGQNRNSNHMSDGRWRGYRRIPTENPYQTNRRPYWSSVELSEPKVNHHNSNFFIFSGDNNSYKPSHSETTQGPGALTFKPNPTPNFRPKPRPTGTYNYNNQMDNNRKRISEIKCEEYSETVSETIAGLPLTLDPKPININVHKCISAQQLIVGGENSSLGEFPHMAAIGFSDKGKKEKIGWYCGGTLISDYFVLTAAHCASTRKGKPIRVRLGEHNLNRNDDGAHPEDFSIAEIITHPDYKNPSKYNDIALLRLSRKVNFRNEIRPACLNVRHTISQSKAIASGWGSMGYGQDSSEVLLKVALNIIDHEHCNRTYSSNYRLPQGIIDSQICAGDLRGGKDTCQGDSGGPIGITSNKNRCIHYVIGITSFGKNCAQPNSPGVYTRVSSFIPWIERIVWPKN